MPHKWIRGAYQRVLCARMLCSDCIKALCEVKAVLCPYCGGVLIPQ